MPNFTVTLDNGQVVTVDADRQPTPQEVHEFLNKPKEGAAPAQTPAQGGEQTSVGGAFTRAVGAGVGPGVAAMSAFEPGAAVGASIGAFGGPLDPITVPLGGFIGGGIASGIAAAGAAWAQRKAAHVIAPQTMEKLDKLRDADIVQHPYATAAGDIASMVGGAKWAGTKGFYGLAKIPKFLMGKAEQDEAKAAKAVLGGMAAQAGLQVGQTAVTEQRLPSAREIAEGTVAAVLFHEPRFKKLPRALSAAAASIVEKGKGLYAREDQTPAAVHGDVRTQQAPAEGVSPQGGGPGVQPSPGPVAQAAQVSLEKAKITGKPGDWTVTYGGHEEHYTTQHHARIAADELETRKREPGAVFHSGEDLKKFFTDEKGFTDMAAVDKHIQGLVTQALDNFQDVTLVTDGGRKRVQIVGHTGDMLVDSKRQKWGSLGLLTTPGEGIEIGPRMGAEGEHVHPLTPQEQEEHERQVMEAAEQGRRVDDRLAETAKQMGVPIQTHDQPLTPPRPDDPFAGDRMAFMDKTTGTMHVNRQRLQNWLRNIPESQHGRAIETLINHEKIHDAVSDKDAMDYYNQLTSFEKMLVTKRYTGRLKGIPGRFTEQQLAHEAIRGRIEQLSHMTPTEVVDAVAEEHWTNRMVYWLEDFIANLRKRLGTRASLGQHEILDRAMRALDVAKEATAPADPAAIGKEIGFEFKRNEFPGMSAEGMTEEEKTKFREQLKPVWEFTNRSAAADDPMGGHTFYVPEGSSRTDIMRRYNEIRKQYGQPPEAYNRKKETDEERLTRELHIAQANLSAVERRHEAGMAVNPQELAEAKAKLQQAWSNALDFRFPEAFDRREEEAPFEPSRAKGGGSKQYPATPEDWAEWQRLRAMPIRKPDGSFDMEMMQARENMKNKYGGMPPLEPGSQPIEAFDRRAAEEELRRREAERQARIKRKAKREAAGEKAPELSMSVEEELRRREEAKAKRIARGALESTDVPPGVGALGQHTLFMPPSAEKVVVPTSAVEAGAAPGMTAAQVTGSHGMVDAQGNPVPDKPGFIDDYLNGEITFSAAPRTREAEVQGETEGYTEYRRRSERPNYDDFKDKLAELVGAHWPEERVREIWNDGVWRHLQSADNERLIQLAKTSRSKILASWQTGNMEDLLRRLEPGAPEVKEGFQEEINKPTRLEGEGTSTIPSERKPTTMVARPSESTFALESEVAGESQHEADVRRSVEYKRMQRERVAAAGEKARKANRNVQTIIGQVGLEMMNESMPPKQAVDRKQVTIEDVDVGSRFKEAGVRNITPEEAKDPKLLGRILGDGSRTFPNSQSTPVSHTKRLVALLDNRDGSVHLVSTYPMGGREEVEVAKTKSGGSISKTAPVRTMVVDPEAAGLKERPNVEIMELLGRKTNTEQGPKEQYQLIQTIPIKDPVKNFMMTFRSPEEYFNYIGKDAEQMERARQYDEFVGETEEIKKGTPKAGRPGQEFHPEGFAGEVSGISSEAPPERPTAPRGTGVTEGEGGGMQGPLAELGRLPQGLGISLIKRGQRNSIQASEALALQNHVLEHTGGAVTEEGFKSAIQETLESAYRGKNRKIVGAIVKATEKAWTDERMRYFQALKEWRGLGKERRKTAPEPIQKNEKQVYEETLKAFYQAITSTETAGQYVQAIMGKFGHDPFPQFPPTGRPRIEAPVQGVSRELTLETHPRSVLGTQLRARQATPGTRFAVAPERPEGTPGAVLPPEMLQERPEAARAPQQGPIPQSGALERRNIQMDPFSHRRQEDPTTLTWMEPSPGMDIVSAPPGGAHPLGRPSPWEGKFRAEAIREPSARQVESEADYQRRQELKKEQLEKKGKYLPGMGPEAFDRHMTELDNAWENLKGQFTRLGTREDVHTQRDAVSNIGNIRASNRGNITRDASRGVLSAKAAESGRYNIGRIKEWFANEKQAKVVRKAAVAVISTGDMVSGGATYTDKYGNKRQRMFWQSNKQKLTAPMAYLPSGVPDVKNSGLIALAEDAMQQAQFSMTKTDPWYQAMGRKWYEAAKELRDAGVWARDHWLDENLKRTVTTAREQLRDQWQKEANESMRMRRDWNYVPGRYDAELWNDDHVFFGAPRILGRNFRQPSTFDNYYQAIHAGPYIAKNLDIADLVEHRSRQGNEFIAKNKWYDYLMKTKDPRTGLAIATDVLRGEPQNIMEKGQIIRDAKGRWQRDPQGNLIRGRDQPKTDEFGKILTTPGKRYIPAGYEPVLLDNGRKELAVLTGFKNAVEMAAGESPLRQLPITRNALHLGQWIKHYGILIYDSFHPARLLQYAAALGGLEPKKLESYKIGAARGFAALEYRPEDLDRAVEVGSVMKSDADWARETVNIKIGGKDYPATRHEILNMALEQGANLGRLQDALFSQTKHWFPLVDWMNRKVFRELTRGWMAEAVVRNFEALNKAHPEMNAVSLMRDVSKDMNFFFGSIGRQGLVKSPLVRDMLQLTMLAPQWVEGLAQKETRFYSRLTGVSRFALGREGPYLGALGGAMAKGLAFWFGMTQVMNLITRGKLTFQNEEEDHKLDAWIPAGHSGFWVSPMGVFAELSHDILRLFETKPTAWDALDQVGRNKLGPWGRMLVVLTTKQNAQGEFIPTTWGRVKEAASTLTPLPITLSWPLRQYAGAPLGMSRANQPGSFIRQAGASLFGVKGQPADSPLQRMNRLASRFVQQNHLRPDTMEMIPTTEPSYSKMRSALRADDLAGAQSMLDELRKDHTDSQIYHAMATWARAPLTGSHKNERQFLQSLTPEQLKIYSEAMEERLNLLQGYIQVYQNSAR